MKKDMRVATRLTLVGIAGAIGVAYMALTATAPPVVAQPFGTYTIRDALQPGALAGDSLKVVILWKQAEDSAKNGPVDSTVYTIRSSKPAAFFGGAALAANTDQRRAKGATAFADSFKLARPSPGDSAVFQVKNFVQCRKGDCSIPGGAGFQYKATFAPPATMPSGTKVIVF